LKTFVKEIENSGIKAVSSRIPVSIGILAGLKKRPTPMKRIEQQVQAVRKRGFAGVSFFFYESLGDRDSAFQSLFPTAVARPQITHGWAGTTQGVKQ
jgi:uncharacterized lipoprotein YddW (UPF0748 family)